MYLLDTVNMGHCLNDHGVFAGCGQDGAGVLQIRGHCQWPDSQTEAHRHSQNRYCRKGGSSSQVLGFSEWGKKTHYALMIRITVALWLFCVIPCRFMSRSSVQDSLRHWPTLKSRAVRLKKLRPFYRSCRWVFGLSPMVSLISAIHLFKLY